MSSLRGDHEAQAGRATGQQPFDDELAHGARALGAVLATAADRQQLFRER